MMSGASGNTEGDGSVGVMGVGLKYTAWGSGNTEGSMASDECVYVLKRGKKMPPPPYQLCGP
jgi:hypothetical protein